MPSKEELCFMAEGKPSAQDFFQRDIDELVLEIKENLRLKSRPSHLPKGRSRVTPYNVPSRTESKCSCCDGRRCLQKAAAARRTEPVQDPYEALQVLLKDGDLIKEAVRRLQLVTPKQQRCVYDSDDELRTPPFPFDHIQV